jgi:isopenicillin-N N-acyltransferase-like protein
VTSYLTAHQLWSRRSLTTNQIGFQHGEAARVQIGRCIEFYANLFLKSSKQEWPQVLQHASTFEQQAKEKWPAYHEEIRGIADGAGKELLDIFAINVRTEITFGMFSDGCTALAWQTDNRSWLAQNWDVSCIQMVDRD